MRRLLWLGAGGQARSLCLCGGGSCAVLALTILYARDTGYEARDTGYEARDEDYEARDKDYEAHVLLTCQMRGCHFAALFSLP